MWVNCCCLWDLWEGKKKEMNKNEQKKKKKKKIKRAWDSLISFYISVEIESVTYVAFLYISVEI
jgi:hypothetical protein